MRTNINLNDYRAIYLRDSLDAEIYGVILLNIKEDVEDFQYAITEAKEKHQKEIDIYGDDWHFISQELDDFDYIDDYIQIEETDYVEY